MFVSNCHLFAYGASLAIFIAAGSFAIGAIIATLIPVKRHDRDN